MYELCLQVNASTAFCIVLLLLFPPLENVMGNRLTESRSRGYAKHRVGLPRLDNQSISRDFSSVFDAEQAGRYAGAGNAAATADVPGDQTGLKTKTSG